MSAGRLDDPWIKAPIVGITFVIVYVALGTLLFGESLGDSALLGGVGGVVFTFVYGVFLNRQQ